MWRFQFLILVALLLLLQVEGRTKRAPFPSKPVGDAFSFLQEDKLLQALIKKASGKSKASKANVEYKRKEPLDWKAELTTFINAIMDW